jgi:hypothetical protein
MHDAFWSAADSLLKTGWCQNAFASECGRECLIQSILSRFGLRGKDYVLDHRYMMMLDYVLADYYGEYRHDLTVAFEHAPKGATNDEVIEQAIIAWHNRVGRTVEEVIMVLKLAGHQAWNEWWDDQLVAAESIESDRHFASMRTPVAA